MEVPTIADEPLNSEAMGAELLADMPAAVAAPETSAALVVNGEPAAPTTSSFSFKDFAVEHGLTRFAKLLSDAGLA
eukprot:6892871-Prymnesium_polylepis.1